VNRCFYPFFWKPACLIFYVMMVNGVHQHGQVETGWLCPICLRYFAAARAAALIGTRRRRS
jgi:hypothetical protein